VSGSRPEVVCAINPEKVFIWPLCAGDLPREYFYFGLPARQVVSANHFERVADSRVTTFSHRIATHSPFARTGNRTDLPSWITPGLVDSLVKALDSLKLTQTSALTAPRSCTEGSNPFPSATQSAMQRKLAKFPGQSGGMAAISRISFQNRTGENVPLIPRGSAIQPFSLQGPHAVRFQQGSLANAMRSETDGTDGSHRKSTPEDPAAIVPRLMIPAIHKI
jgi:hypothetical protein